MTEYIWWVRATIGIPYLTTSLEIGDNINTYFQISTYFLYKIILVKDLTQ